jgi:hypothetical protein
MRNKTQQKYKYEVCAGFLNPYSAIDNPKRSREVAMTYTNVALKDKVLEMYPEIKKHNFSVGLDFDERKNAYLLTFKRGTEVLTTHLEKKDADECMNGIKCVYLGFQVAQFIKNFEERETFSRKAS